MSIRNMIHDCIKIKYVREGYLPNIPYHLISDEEMCSAFMGDGENDFFSYQYPLVCEELSEQYDELKQAIMYHMQEHIKSDDVEHQMPSWVYSYMLGSTFSVNTEQVDMHYMLPMLGEDNLNDVFTPEASMACYKMSVEWLRKIPLDKLDHRPPTMFGEPHVIKALRLREVSVK